ncbi:hypothetical protein HER10_EVM0004241 [Colletotrichum scovillei]|uniref:HET-s domain protein n=1 Tax=Colletotrichum scovillei TaxID=1209932 RepID=A0A9P7RL56_9PEZI|nr:uncharacterized protein HER10_EVM0004241 [Colletotrichum scovillei]KAF4777592.1 hypothetical protein HER10_EVM0004241 [Colletotrichum scovillei]KAG7059477.1 HET-s domain protein [Colletotrichum scovillei]KAG7078086.1 HET-s domain protein [Colletotrichum scovillei]KAG7085209.1 HET-s domain protein [Colletotrichum scovillei]
MEAAGLVLGAVALIKPICSTIDNTLTNYSNFGKDADRLRLRFSIQRTRLGSMERVLFEDSKFAPAMPGCLIEHLPKTVCDDILGLLRELYGLLMEYAAVRGQYKVQDRAESLELGDLASMSEEDRVKSLSSSKKESAIAQQKSVGWAKKMLWVAFDKSSTEKLVSEFEAWTERIQNLLEAAWWPSTFFETLERLQKLEKDVDAGSVGLLRGIELRKLVITPPADISPGSYAKEALLNDLSIMSKLPNFELGNLKGSDGCYLIESKGYTPDSGSAVSAVVIRERVIQLAALLHDAPSSDPALAVLPCTHYFEDTPGRRFGLLFKLPKPTNPSAPPLTVSNLLDERSKAGRPSLSARLRLAHRLAACVQRLHTYSWVHKSIRSENILLFPEHAGMSAILEGARLIGFEYSRQDSDFSDQFGESELKRNIYRHPERWGQPTKRFGKIHDIYALGVVLLEIGLWSRADQIDKGALVAPEMEDKPKTTAQTRLLKHAEQRLAFFAGETFQNIVVGCLAGKMGDVRVVDCFATIVGKLEKLANSVF